MSKLKIVSIVGARPQFIKYGPLGRELKKEFKEILIHTGQHYDKNMSDLIFKQLAIPEPDYNLNIGSYMHGRQTSLMLQNIEEKLLFLKPDIVIVFGDTNSTLAGALAARKLNIKLAHVEAGLRSYNKKMPEEINRVVTDHCSDLLFCPTKNSEKNLFREGIEKGVYFTGDIMYDAYLENEKIAGEISNIIVSLELQKLDYFLVTIHRAENTDIPVRLKNIITALNKIDHTIVFPVHPRTRNILKREKIDINPKILFLDPVGYLDMLVLLRNCKKVLTDSGGLQKEAYFAGKYCKTLRDETEWIETLKDDKNVICGDNTNMIIKQAIQPESNWINNNDYYGDGKARNKIIRILNEYCIKSKE